MTGCHEQLHWEAWLATGAIPRSADNVALRLCGGSPAHPTLPPPCLEGLPPPDSPLPRVSQRHTAARNGGDGRQPFPDAPGIWHPRLSALVCDPSTGGWLRHSNRPGTSGSQGCPDHDALHVRIESRWARVQSPPDSLRKAASGKNGRIMRADRAA